MKNIAKILLIVCTGMAFSTISHAENNQLKADISRFWSVTEAEISATPKVERSNDDNRVVYQPRVTASSTVVVKKAILIPNPKPSMEASQKSTESSQSSHFGLRLFDQIPLFDFVWGNKESKDEDSLTGRR